MSDRSIINRRLPDVRRVLRADKADFAMAVRVFTVTLATVFMLPGCLAYHLHEDNPLTISMGNTEDRQTGNAPLPGLVKNSKQSQLEDLLRTELHDATPEEKAQWSRDVKQLDPAQAKLALQLRREMLDRKAALTNAATEMSADALAPNRRKTASFAQMPTELKTNQVSSGRPNSATPTFGHSFGQAPSTAAGIPVRTVADRRPVGRRPGEAPPTLAGPSLPAIDVPAIGNQNSYAQATPLLPSSNEETPGVAGPGFGVSTDPLAEESNPFEASNDTRASETDSQRGGIRNRFSKWGARFGFGNDEQPPANESQPDVVLTPPAAELQTLDQQPLDRRPVANLQSLILRRENEVRDWGVVPPNDDARRQNFIRQHVELRLLYLMSGQQSRALDAIPGISPSEQEFWQQVLWGLSDYFDLEGKSNRTERISQTVKQFETAVNRLKEEARLSVRNLNFCRKISSYGNYERFRRDDFTAGQPVLVYSEVENFKSVPVADGRYRTLLKSRIDIFRGDVRGQLVDSVDFKPTEDLCRNPRRDYFHSYELTIPQDIGLGPHVLRVTVEDQLTGKQTTQTVNFVVK